MKIKKEMAYLLDLEYKEIAHLVGELGEKPFRAKQLHEWLFHHRVTSFDECKNLSADFRKVLKENAIINKLKLKDQKISSDGTIRFEFITIEGHEIYAVFIPTDKRFTICLSSQIGCPIRCTFCASGKVRFLRDLSRGEIIEQILQVEKATGKRISSVLFMGMGEPLLNYDNVVSAIRLLRDPDTFNIGRRHITISTVGMIPEIKRLEKDRIGVRLAVSLHASDDSIRKKLIPVTEFYPIEDVLDSAFSYANTTNSRLTIEYILIKGLNDMQMHAQELVRLIRQYNISPEDVQVNLIPYNKVKGNKFVSSSPKAIEIFKNCLTSSKVLVMLRQPRGQDIGSACGQLGYVWENEQ